MFICLVLCMPTEAFNGQSTPSSWFFWANSSRVGTRSSPSLPAEMLTIQESPKWSESKKKTLVIVFRKQMTPSELVCRTEPTSSPVPGFQWYPNTSSSLTVLLLSTCFSSSSWGKQMHTSGIFSKRYQHRSNQEATFEDREEPPDLQQGWEMDQPEIVMSQFLNFTLKKTKQEWLNPLTAR